MEVIARYCNLTLLNDEEELPPHVLVKQAKSMSDSASLATTSTTSFE